MYTRTTRGVFLTQETKNYKSYLTEQYKLNVYSDKKVTKKPVIVDLVFHVRNKTEREDLDNKVKPVLDCMSDVFFKDDKQVEVLFLEKKEFNWAKNEKIEYKVYEK